MFAAVISLGSAPPAARATSVDRLEEAINPYDQADVSGSWESDHARIVQTLTWNTAESHREDVPHVCAETGRVIAAWVRLDNREDLLGELAASEQSTDPMLVLAAYERWGEQCVEHLLGDFSFVIHDPAQRTVFAARDPLGVRPLYYHAADDVVICSTTAAVFHVIDGLALTPSEEWIAAFAMMNSKSHTETPWPQVRKLAGGHRVTFAPGQPPVPIRYHAFRDDPPVAFTRDETWVRRYRTVLEEAVRCRLRTTFKLGSETSGGIDSSTCVGFAAELWDGPLEDVHTFGFLHAEDEADFILETSKLHGLVNNHIHPPTVERDFAGLRERTLTVLGHPAEHGNGPGHDPFYVECGEHGVRTLLSGFGGDEVVTNPGELLARELIDRRKFGLLYANLHGRRVLKPLRFVRALQRHRRGSTMDSPLMSTGRSNLQHLALRSDVLERHHLVERYVAGFRFDEGYRTINEFALDNRLNAAFVPTRLETCTLMAQSRGVEYRWPLLDVRLVQQYLSTPAIEKKRRGFGRYLHRRALTGAVPPSVQWKESKYMGSPLVERSRESIADEVADLLPGLHHRVADVIDRDRLLELAQGEPSFALRRHVRSLALLNEWLHRYHPTC